jgi:putative oxidoreductase
MHLCRLRLLIYTFMIKNYIPSNVARMVFAATMALFGVFHFLGAKDMAGMVPAYLGFVPAEIWVYLTGLGLLGAAASFILDQKVKLAGYLLALMLVLFALMLHVPCLGDAVKGQLAMIMMLKDLGLAMCAVLIANASEN